MRLKTMIMAAAVLGVVPVAAGAQPAAQAPSGNYKLDPTHASVTFRVMHFGLSRYTMRFAKFDSTVTLNAADLTKSALNVTIDPKSIRTDFPFVDKEDFDAELAGPKFLDAAKYPTIRFVSKSIARTGPNTGTVAGDLTMRGITKPVTLNATFNGAAVNPFNKKQLMGVSATGTFKRSDFGVTYAAPAVADEIEVMVEAEYELVK